jgi:CHAT domain-containing protein
MLKILCFCLVLSLPAWADDRSDDDIQFAELASDDVMRLQNQLGQPVPEGIGLGKTNEIYREKLYAAFKLGNVEQQLYFTEEWRNKLPQGGRSKALAEYIRIHSQWGKISAAMQAADELLNDYPRDSWGLIKVAELYTAIGLFEKSQKILDSASEYARKSYKTPNQQFSNLRLQLHIAIEKNKLLRRQGKFEQAILMHSELDTIANQIRENINNSSIDKIQRKYAEGRLAAYSSIRFHEFLLSNQDFLAAKELNEQLDYFKLNVPHTSLRINLYRNKSDLFFHNGKFFEAYKALQPAYELLPYGRKPNNGTAIKLIVDEIATLIGQKKWQEATRQIDLLDRETNADDGFKKLTGMKRYRTVAALETQQIPKALNLSEKLYQYANKVYGSEHYFTRMDGGLLALALLRSGRIQEARPLFEQVYAACLNPQGVSIRSTESGLWPLYRRMILEGYLTLLSQDSHSASIAFQVVDLLRSSVVQRSVTESAARSVANQVGLGDLVRSEQDGRNEISALYDLLSQLHDLAEDPVVVNRITVVQQRIAILSSLLTKNQIVLKAQFPHYDQLTRPQPPDVPSTAKLLKPGEALISLFPTTDQTYVWAVSSTGQSAFHIAKLGSAQLELTVQALRQALDPEAGSRKLFPSQLAYELYQQLLAPIEQAWSGQTSLIFTTAGVLGQIPMAILITTPPANSDSAWLVRQASITHLPSVATFQALRMQAAPQGQRKALLAFGDPEFASAPAMPVDGLRHLRLTRSSHPDAISALAHYGDLPALPETRDEIRAIATAMHADPEHDLFYGKNASRKQVLSMRLNDRQVVDFSTHGLVAGDLPGLNQPALALAGTSNADDSPLLTLQDVLGLKLDADWVVLSACNTAAADGQASEAISGLGRGFFYAGSRALLVTHWSVESNSAQQLVTAIFKHYGEGVSTRAESLRQAQLEMIEAKKYAHPSYWAPYALVGDGAK